ncbi:MAG: glycosyltransferase family 39 protein [Bacteroidota bacterium]
MNILKTVYYKYNFIVFLLIVLFIGQYYGYWESMFYAPQSIHSWRMCDCASMALNYYQDNRNFLSPEIHNLMADGGQSGKTVGEFPLLYYSISKLYGIFGHHDYIFRIVTGSIFIIAISFLYKLTHKLFNNFEIAIITPLLLFSSPVIAYYSNSFIIDSTSLSLSIIGWYYLVNYQQKKRNFHLYVSFLLFLLATLFKVTSAVNLIVISGLLLYNTLIVKENRLKFKIQYIILFAITGILVFAWYAYAKSYNTIHKVDYFATYPWPIWEMNKEQILNVINRFRTIWIFEYYHISAYFYYVALMTFVIINFKKANANFLLALIILFLATISYILLFFAVFDNHDYYLVCLYILPIIMLYTAFNIIKNHYSKTFKNVFLVLSLIVLLINIYHTKERFNNRYFGEVNNYNSFKSLNTIEPYFKYLGIPLNAKVISAVDYSPNISLYLMNRKGWTLFWGTNKDAETVKKSIKNGATYIIINNSGAQDLSYFNKFIERKIGQYDNIEIFKLKTL